MTLTKNDLLPVWKIVRNRVVTKVRSKSYCYVMCNVRTHVYYNTWDKLQLQLQLRKTINHHIYDV